MKLQEELKKIPGVDKVLCDPSLNKIKEEFGLELLTYAVRIVLENVRAKVFDGGQVTNGELIVKGVIKLVEHIVGESLKPVVNATGVILHTNLGRAPLGKEMFAELEPILTGYSNLEFNLQTGQRNERLDHIKGLLTFITGTEDAAVVNNNAAAIFLIMKTLAEKKEVIVSRGELIEIGGSFRIPDIMKASGVKMIEVGTTNKTRLQDYEDAITKNTRIIFKAHKANYYIGGYSEEVELYELSHLAKKHNLILVYDAGSGLLKRPMLSKHLDEPNIRNSVGNGADLVTFSCDKLMGTTQAGIIVGKTEFIKKLTKAPLMRTIRVDKFTIAALNVILKYYLNEEVLIKKSPVFMMLNRKKEDLHILAEKLSNELEQNGIKTTICECKAKCGGGALPHLELDSYAVKILSPNQDKKFAERLYKSLMKYEKPVLAILREGELLFDVFTLQEEEINTISIAMKNCI